jgi:hypothetical protein
MKSIPLWFLLFGTFAAAASPAGNDMIIPAAGRTPGAYGTVWRTDLVITNLTREYERLAVTVTLVERERSESFELDLRSLETVVIPDFLLTRFGREEGVGIVRVESAAADAQLAAQARVYNDAPIGRFGQNIPATTRVALPQESWIAGLESSGGYRSNLGVANPGDEPATVTGLAYGPQGQIRSFRLIVEPRTLLQIEVGALVSLDVRTIRLTADRPVYPYGSLIRNDTGDPQFLAPLTALLSEDFAIAPPCDEPAPLYFSENPAPGYFVVFGPGVDAAARAAELAAKYGFTPDLFLTIQAFIAELSPDVVAALRCEAGVIRISQNAALVLLTTPGN